MAATDNVIFVNTNTNSVTLTLPVPTNGRVFEVKDSTGNAAVRNITVSQHTTEKIDGQNTFVISENYGYLRLVSDGTNWFTNYGSQGENFITALTGDVTATGPGSAVATLATVNGNVGTFAVTTVNAKGLTTAAQNLSGDATSSGAVLTLATVNSNVGTFASVTVNGKGLVTAAANLSGDATTSGAALTLATVNSNVGTFASVTVNGKGLVTAAANLSGDATTSGAALTLATVNGNVGSFGSSTSIPSFTVNAKGLITAASGNVVIAPAGTLTGSTLASGVTASSLTSVGTLTSLSVSGAIAQSGTVSVGISTTCTNNENIFKMVGDAGGATSTQITEIQSFYSTQKLATVQVLNTNATAGSSGGIYKILTNDGTGTLTAGLTIDQNTLVTLNKQVGIGASPSANTLLDLNSAVSSAFTGTGQFGINITPTFNSAATNQTIGISVRVQTQAAVYTTALASAIAISGLSLGAGSAATRQIGLEFRSLTTTASNNALIADNSAFSGNYFIHSTSTNPSAIGAGATFGSTSHNTVVGLRFTGSANLTGTTQFGIYSDPSFNSSATVAGHSFFAQVQTTANSFTMPVGSAFNASTAGIGASSAVTRLINFLGANQTAGTNNAFLTDSTSFTGNYGIFLSSSRASIFGGRVAFGGASGTTDTSAYLNIGNCVDSSTSTYGFYADQGHPATTTAGGYGFVANNTTAAGAQTLATLYKFYASDLVKGAGSTITRVAQFYAVTPTQGTNNATLTDNISFSGNYFINQSGSAASVLGGSLTVNAAINSSKATVGGDTGLTVDNTDGTNAASDADFIARTASGGGDPYIRFIATGLTTWATGLDRSAAQYKISRANQLGSNDYLIIDANGLIGLSSPIDTNTYVNITGTGNLASGSQRGMTMGFVAASSATSEVVGYRSEVSTTAAAFTTGLRAQFYARSVTRGAGSTITRDIKYYNEGDTSQGSSNAQFSDNTSFTSDWLMHFNSTREARFAGRLSAGGDGTNTAILTLGGGTNPLANTDQRGAVVFHTATSGATGSVVGYYSGATTAASAFTAGYRAGFQHVNATKGAGSTITRDIAYYGTQPDQGTNNAFLADNNSFSGSFFVHQSGTSNSVLGGALVFTNGATASAGSIANVGNVLTITGQGNGTKINASDNTQIAKANDSTAFFEHTRSAAFIGADVASAATIAALTSNTSYVRLTGSTATTLQGIQANTTSGQFLILFNNTGQNLTISNENGTASAANRIQTNTGADVVSTGNSAHIFIYDNSQSRWILVAGQP